MFRPNPQSNGIWRWGLQEVISHEGRTLLHEIIALKNETQRDPSPLLSEDTAKKTTVYELRLGPHWTLNLP